MAWTEADFKRHMVKSVKEAGGYARRIEDQYAVGTLDLVFVLRGSVYFVEAKLINGRSFGPSPRQGVEIKRIQDAGGFAFTVGCRENEDWKTYSFMRDTVPMPVDYASVRHYNDNFGPFHQMLIHYGERIYERQPKSSPRPPAGGGEDNPAG